MSSFSSYFIFKQTEILKFQKNLLNLSISNSKKKKHNLINFLQPEEKRNSLIDLVFFLFYILLG
jgi:hypothetical protein